MTTVTLSQKYQIVVPKEVRSRLHLRKGQKFKIIVQGETFTLIPEKPLLEFKGVFPGLSSKDLRDKEDGP